MTAPGTSVPWLTVVGIGADGLDGLTPATRRLVEDADVLVGGGRHLAMADNPDAERISWSDGVGHGIEEIAARKGQRVVVLATGEPLWHGIGVTLARRFGSEDMAVVPHVGALSLACARMLWPMQETVLASLHAPKLETLALHLVPGRRLVLLARDGTTPAGVARLLAERGYGTSRMSVFENLGSPEEERRLDALARDWAAVEVAPLNTIAVALEGGADAWVASRAAGLPEALYQHDGKITKREVRAATLARLDPLAGRLLWDVGAGSGAVGIEWMRAADRARAIAIESDPEQRSRIALNAAALGVPTLEVVAGEAPAALADLADPPDAVFVGGGVAAPGVLEACCEALRPHGVLVANAVTLEAQQRLMTFRENHGGELIRLSVARSGPVGRLTALRPLIDVLQWAWTKP